MGIHTTILVLSPEKLGRALKSYLKEHYKALVIVFEMKLRIRPSGPQVWKSYHA